MGPCLDRNVYSRCLWDGDALFIKESFAPAAGLPPARGAHFLLTIYSIAKKAYALLPIYAP